MRNCTTLRAAAVVLTVLVSAESTLPLVANATDIPETVIVTVRPKPGAEAELEQVMVRHWTTAQRLGLVLAEPHVRIQAKDGEGKPYLVEIFTWRDADIPDNAPAEIQAIWADMNRLVEARRIHATPARHHNRRGRQRTRRRQPGPYQPRLQQHKRRECSDGNDERRHR